MPYRSIQHYNPNRYKSTDTKFSNIYFVISLLMLKWLNFQCVYSVDLFIRIFFSILLERFYKMNFMEGFTSRRIQTPHLLHDKINLL